MVIYFNGDKEMKKIEIFLKELICFIVMGVLLFFLIISFVFVISSLDGIDKKMSSRVGIVFIFSVFIILCLVHDLIYPSLLSKILGYRYIDNRNSNIGIKIVFNNIVKYFVIGSSLYLQTEKKLYPVEILLNIIYAGNYIYLFFSKENQTFVHKILNITMQKRK